MKEVDYGLLIAILGSLGIGAYVVASIWHHFFPPPAAHHPVTVSQLIVGVLEIAGFGAGMGLGVRMIDGAFHAKLLASITDLDGKVVEIPLRTVSFGEHRWEIVLGGYFVALGSAYSTYTILRLPPMNPRPLFICLNAILLVPLGLYLYLLFF